jgi:hypothetical protein
MSPQCFDLVFFVVYPQHGRVRSLYEVDVLYLGNDIRCGTVHIPKLGFHLIDDLVNRRTAL